MNFKNHLTAFSWKALQPTAYNVLSCVAPVFSSGWALALDGTGMEFSMSTKDWLEIVVIPIILVLIALVWPLIQNWHRCRRFKKLIFRELHEIGPYPSESERDHWAEHLAKNFAHRTILKEVSPNRDFVLSLNPDLVYNLLQLWDAYDAKDEKQWLHYLGKLAEYDSTGKMKHIHADWGELCDRYRRKVNS